MLDISFKKLKKINSIIIIDDLNLSSFSLKFITILVLEYKKMENKYTTMGLKLKFSLGTITSLQF